MPASTLSIAVFVALHLFIGKLHGVDTVPRSRWLSFAAGVAVAYVFLHLLPELGRHQDNVDERTMPGRWRSEVYFFAMLGLTAFYGLERLARAAVQRAGEPAAVTGSFWLHVASFAGYNGLIGYLLVHCDMPGAGPLALFSIALGLHLLATDYGLRSHYRQRYDRIVRYVLAAAVLAGWGIGLWIELAPTATALLFAVLAGAVVLNVLKEELPAERESRFVPFLAGAIGYGAVLMAAF